MKFIHIADVHLGAQPEAAVYSQSRGRELWESFEKILGVCEDERTDLLLIAGDLFHRQPLVRELKEVNYLFSELTATKVVLIAGNHDHLQKDSNYRSFEWNDNVYPLFGKNMSIFRNWKQRCMDSVTMNGKFVSRFMTMWLQQALKRMKFCWLTEVVTGIFRLIKRS